MEIPKIETASMDSPGDFKPQKAILVIVAFLFIVSLVWFFFFKTNPDNTKDLINAGLNTATSTFNFGTKKGDPPPQNSYYKGMVEISKIDGVMETFPEKEYITIEVVQKNLSPLDVSKWFLVNSAGQKVVIGAGAELPTFGKVIPTEPIKIKGEDVLIVSTGRSPNGVSFRLNACSPYFEQFMDFIPPIPVNECGALQYAGVSSLEQACYHFVMSVPRCEQNTKKLPENVTATCKKYIDAHLNYAGCVKDNESGSHFFKKEWRIFLGQKLELWKEKDTIRLFDGDGRLVDTVKY